MEKSVIPFVFLLFCCWTHVEEATVQPTVLPPTNVTLHCHNMKNTLVWTYDQLSDGLKFNVIVSSLIRDAVILDSTTTSVDLSEFSDPDNEYMVMVSAMKDGVESEPVPEDGINYSYFKDAPVTVICNVDLPLVDLTTEDTLLHFSFTHPGLLYPTGHKPRKKKNTDWQDGLPEFAYNIEVTDLGGSHKYHCTESVCQDKIPVHDSKKSYCLNITGEMKKMSVQATKKYCSEPLKTAGSSVLAYTVPIVLVLCGLLIGAMIFFRNTNRSTLNPAALNFHRRNNPPLSQPLPATSDYSSVYFPPSSPEPLITPSQDTSHYSSSGGDDLRLPLGIPGNEDESARGEVAEAQGAPEEGYTDSRFLDEEEEEPINSYEPRNGTVVGINSESNNMQ